jgi:hypothetical protein
VPMKSCQEWVCFYHSSAESKSGRFPRLFAACWVHPALDGGETPEVPRSRTSRKGATSSLHTHVQASLSLQTDRHSHGYGRARHSHTTTYGTKGTRPRSTFSPHTRCVPLRRTSRQANERTTTTSSKVSF